VLGTLGRLDPIAAGVLLAAVLDGEVPQIPRRLKISMLLFAGAMLPLAALALFHSNNPDARQLVWSYVLVAASCGCLLLATVGAKGFMRRSWLVYLGRISYGLYMYHGAVLLLAAAIFGRNAAACFVALPVTIAIAAASYRWLESPFLRLKRRFEYVTSQP
jgi:peptidoglycan/LPS O-acetylase OafA/YrhL